MLEVREKIQGGYTCLDQYQRQDLESSYRTPRLVSWRVVRDGALLDCRTLKVNAIRAAKRLARPGEKVSVVPNCLLINGKRRAE